MSITRLSGGLTPADGDDPRTFPAIWNAAADDIEQIESDAGGLLVASEDDTGSPWNIPFMDGGDAGTLAKLSEDVADAVAAGLTAASGLVEVKSAIFTGVQDASVAGRANVAVTDLSITHEVDDAANKLIISAFLGVAAHGGGVAQVGLAVHDGTNLIAIGTSVSDRVAVTAGGQVTGEGSTSTVTMPSVTFVHTPGSGSKTYTVRAININDNTRTLYINRSAVDTDNASSSRGVSSLVIQEVRV